MAKARYDLSINKSSTVTSKGEVTTYGFDLIDTKSVQIIETAQFDNEKDAQAYIDSTKKKYPDLTIDGKQNYDPFKDGNIKSQTDVEFGGFAEGFIGDERALYDSRGGAGDVALKRITEDDLGDMSPEAVKVRTPPPPSKTLVLAQDLCGLTEDEKRSIYALSLEELAKRGRSGVFGQLRNQVRVERQMLPCEKLVARGPDNNVFIVVGNDRVDKPHTGCGGQGHTKSDMVDIVVGLGGYCAPENVEVEVEDKETGETRKVQKPAKVNPNLYLDAARVYLSQKTHVDKNFGIGEFGSEAGKESDQDDKNIGKYGGKSAFVAKADNIRLIGRESIRIVTGTDLFNSKGGKVFGKAGIELVAMNNIKTLQPLVLGDNLLVALNLILDNIEALAKLMHGFTKYQTKYNRAMQNHVHHSPFFGLVTVPSGEAIAAGIQCDIETAAKTELSILKHITNLQGARMNYLTNTGKAFINSELNKCN